MTGAGAAGGRRWARRILTSYFCDAEVEFLISTFSPDIVWMGGGADQRAEGAEAVAAAFRAGKSELVPGEMSDERYVSRELARMLPAGGEHDSRKAGGPGVFSHPPALHVCVPPGRWS